MIIRVFSCAKLTCGHFYHPKCVADLLFRKNKTKAAECEKKIAAGELFTCPVHKCHVCKQDENREVEELQLAVCRRCPKSYHRKCLPREIAFEDIEDGIVQRAWEYLLPDRILIYCLEHKIEEDLGTPLRNHVTFPEIVERKKDSDMKKSKMKVLAKNNRQVSDYLPQERTSIILPKETEKLFDSEEHQFAVQNDSNNSDGSVPLDCKLSLKEKESAMMEKIEAPPAVTRESILKKMAVPSTPPYAVENIDKRITLGEVKNSSEMELKAYLGPFLYHKNYTPSFGRCFTKVDKLQQIVNKLHWYVQNDDMIVDFSCGANDFSRLMKEKLDEAGKRCSFKNYDIVRPKDDFNFEKKDWMKVEPQELPTGSKLIMGLSPPFWVDPSRANEFIDKALTFKPKLLILIVPRGTQKLDSKSLRYELIWEDCKMLSGKSFYMPGSVNEDDMQIKQLNLEPLSLYLWSRVDWTTIYKAIALQRSHASTTHQERPQAQNQVVHPPKKQMLERHEKEAAIAQQATTKEVSKKKITVKCKKRSSRVIDNNIGGKRRRETTTVQGAVRRNEGETHISPPETRDSNTDMSKSQHPLEPSETPTTNEGNNKKIAVQSEKRTPLVIDINFGRQGRREATTVQGADRRNEGETHISPPETRDSSTDMSKGQHPLEPSETPTTNEGDNKKIAVESEKRTPLVIDINFGRQRRRETTTVQGTDRRNEGETHISPPETRDSNTDMSKSRHSLEPSETPTTNEGNKEIAVESEKRMPLVIDNNFGRQRRRETTTVQGADRRNEGETHISPPETRDSDRDVSKCRHPLEPSETPTAKEGSMKIAVESKKRIPLVIDNNFGRKRRRETTTVQGADGRNEGVMHISPPETTDSSRGVSKSQHPLEPSETLRKTFPTSLIGAQTSRPSVDASGFASGPVHSFLRRGSCGWLDD